MRTSAPSRLRGEKLSSRPSETAGKAAKGIFTRPDTILRFTLAPTCGGTMLTLEHSGFHGFKLVVVSFVMGRGWKKQLRKRLPIVLEKIANEAIAKKN